MCKLCKLKFASQIETLGQGLLCFQVNLYAMIGQCVMFCISIIDLWAILIRSTVGLGQIMDLLRMDIQRDSFFDPMIVTAFWLCAS